MLPEGKMGNSKPIICDFCKSDAIIFDTVSFEYVCSSCGCVSNEDPNTESMLNSRNNSGFIDRSRMGMPESLTRTIKDYPLL